MRKIVIILVGLALVALAAWWLLRPRGEFSELRGPSENSRIETPPAPRIADYESGGPSRLAILVTDPDSDWIGMVRVLKSRGVPFVMTRDYRRAIRHGAVIAYPTISGRVLSGEAIRGLANHVRRGGGLMTFDLAGGGLEPLFGIAGQAPSRDRATIIWPGRSGTPAVTPLNAAGMEAQLGSLALTPTSAEVLARYGDGSAALTCRRAGGQACVLGVDLGAFANRAMNLRAEALAGSYVDVFADGLDRLADAAIEFYVANEPKAFLIGTAPAPFSGSLLLTHDLDAQRAVANSIGLARDLKARGVTATFFMQTKIVKDWNDEVFFNRDAIPQLKQIAAQGMEIGSHSVAHSYAFNEFQLGEGDEEYPSYQPFVTSRFAARGGTVLGELRVSKFLLDSLLGQSIRSFRPGHLRNPPALPEALAATGFRYTSDLTAPNALTNYPYQLAASRKGPGLVPVWEFPVTIEDEAPPGFAARLEQSAALVERIVASGGVATVLVHPDNGPKLAAELALVDRLRGKAWIGSMGRFADWWTARDGAQVDFDGTTLRVASKTPVAKLRVRFPRSGQYRDIDAPAGSHAFPIGGS